MAFSIQIIPSPNIQLYRPNVLTDTSKAAPVTNSKIQNIEKTIARQISLIYNLEEENIKKYSKSTSFECYGHRHTFCGKISMLTMYGIGKRPKVDVKTMHAIQSGGIHV